MIPAILLTTLTLLIKNQNSGCLDICLFPDGRGAPLPFLSDDYTKETYMGVFTDIFAIPVFLIDIVFWLIFWIIVRIVYAVFKKIRKIRS